MKTKLTKKMLSLFLAVLMVISALPFSAVTASATTLAYNSKPTNFSAHTGKTIHSSANKGYVNDNDRLSDDDYATVYKNLLYSSTALENGVASGQVTTWSGTAWFTASSTISYAKLFYAPTVMLYDGITDPQTSIMFSNWGGTTGRSSINNRLHSAYLSADYDNLSFVRDRWNGNDGRTNFQWLYLENKYVSNYAVKTNESSNHTYNDNNCYLQYNDSSAKYYANCLKYTGDFSNGSYYKKITPRITVYCSCDSSGTGNREINLQNTNVPIYVVNFKPVIAALNDAKSYLSNFNQNNYCAKLVNDYYNAVNDLANYDPNNDFVGATDSNLGSKVTNCANNIESKVTAYTNAKSALTNASNGGHISTSANNGLTATCTKEGKNSDTICSTCGVTLTIGSTIPATGHDINGVEWESADEYKHVKICKTCHLEVSSESHNWRNDSQVNATCTTAGTNAGKTCTVCGATEGYGEILATGHAYAVSGNRYVCTKDATHIKTDADTGEKIDLEAYISTVTEANAELAKTDVYTAESLKVLDDAVKAQANQLDPSNDNIQKDVDAKTTAIRTAIGNLELLVVKYNVVFKYQFVGEEAVEVINDSYDKDEEIELKVPEDALAQGVVYKWYTSTTDGAKPYATSVNSTTLIVNKDITIVAKLQKNTTEVESEVKVNLLDKSGKTIAIAYTSASSITLGENSITVDGNELEAKQIPFYNVRGFKVDGGAAVSSATYQIPDGVTEINVMPNYVAEKKIVITVSSGVKINGKSVSSYEATWNQAITMTAETEVNWYANGKLIAQGTTYKFCANADVTITAETADPATTAPSVEIGYFNYDSSLNKVTVVSNFYAPQGTISDAGVILSTKTNDIETLKKATGGVFKVNSGNFTSNGNQVKISVSRTATTHFTMYALAFVVVDGETYYADSVSTCVY